MTSLSTRKFLALLLIATAAGCGGGSSGSDSSSGGNPGGNPPPGGTPGGSEPPPGDATAMTMSCVDGEGFQCSGGSILRTDNGISLTRSGVQAYGISTSDLAADNPNKTGASGYQPATGGMAEVRIAKADDGTVSSINLLLRNLGLSWDGTTERPPIIETFNPTQGRVVLDGNGRITFVPLPESSDLNFYDYATLGRNGTQAHYANNRYFPRENNPSRCAEEPCDETETEGVSNDLGEWRTGSIVPDWASAGRAHGDGDVHAGDGPPDEEGNPTWLEDGTGFGVPFPGSKGYRMLANWGYRYANLANWGTQDTVLIEEWARLQNEHNKVRVGVVAFGDVTAPAEVPTGGTASYTGIAYGWYTPDASTNPVVYWGNAEASANFATGEVTISIENTVAYDEQNPVPLPAELEATMAIGSRNENAANYATGSASSGAMSGGVSARFFGPVASGTSGPAEIGGALSLSSPANGEAMLGGFIGRRR